MIVICTLKPNGSTIGRNLELYKRRANRLDLTTGKEYEAINENYSFYLITNDRGYNSWIDKKLFKEKSEIRNDILNKLGI